jgi:hypothetical protein
MFFQDFTFIQVREPFNEDLEVAVGMLDDLNPYEISDNIIKVVFVLQ